MSDVIYQASLEPIRGRRVGIIGYGNQAHAHALNLRDSGVPVRVGLREGSPSAGRAKADGFAVESIPAVSAWSDMVCLLTPDHTHGVLYQSDIQESLTDGDALLVAHGFSVLYGQVSTPPTVDVVLVAPVGPGAMLRRLFQQGHGIPASFAVHQDASGRADELALSYAAGIGCTRAGVLRSSFREETETDLFGEQAVLCGGLTGLIEAGFQTLVAAGYQPEIAYFECVHQVKLIVDLVYEFGIQGMYDRISETAEFGAYRAAPRIIDSQVEKTMRELLGDIQSGRFARDWITDWSHQFAELHELRRQANEEIASLENVSERLRGGMTFRTTPGSHSDQPQ